jgi:hypothetical protein
MQPTTNLIIAAAGSLVTTVTILLGLRHTLRRIGEIEARLMKRSDAAEDQTTGLPDTEARLSRP